MVNIEGAPVKVCDLAIENFRGVCTASLSLPDHGVMIGDNNTGANNLGLTVIAEGVETEVAARTLMALGCTRAQGFLFAKPCPPWDIESVLGSMMPSFDSVGTVFP